ncbi:MAG TPA: HAD family phosphatase [Kineosporiaceae bacterium]
MTEQDLGGLVVDWGGVLTASLDGAMAAWTIQDRVNYEHFRDVMRDWVRGQATVGSSAAGVGRPAGPVPSEPTAARAVGGRRSAPRHGGGQPGEGLPGGGEPGEGGGGEPGEGPVAEVEEADDAGPAGASPVHRLERGELSVAEFETTLAEELARRGSPVRAEGLLGRMLGGLAQLEDDMVGLVRRARAAGVRTALLSNSWGDDYPEQLWDGMFDTLVISGRVGMRKPEPEIFRYTCAQLGLPPSACVMVDDLPHNVAGAVAVGMVGVLHTRYETTAEELEILFGASLR